MSGLRTGSHGRDILWCSQWLRFWSQYQVVLVLAEDGLAPVSSSLVLVVAVSGSLVQVSGGLIPVLGSLVSGS